MTRALFVFLALGALVTAAAVGGIILTRDLFYVTDSYRYRLTLNFEVDGRPLVGSGVIQETIHQPPCMVIETNCSHIAVKGDALPVRFPNGRIVFALIEYNGVVTSRAFPHGPPGGSLTAWAGKAFTVGEPWLPQLITFSDLTDPYSIEFADYKNIAQVGGPNARFINATLQITDDPVTRSVDAYLPWVTSFHNKLDRYAGKGALKNLPNYFFGYSLMENLVNYLRRNDL